MTAARFVDIHSHYLFGLDDGAPDLETSLAMIEQAARLNFKALLATPHATEMTDTAYSQQIVENFNLVRQQVQKENIPIELYLAAEMFYSPKIFDWFSLPWATFNHNKKFFLFELSLFDFPEGVGEFIFQCRLQGFVPVLAHPERYRYLHDRLETLLTFVRQGCLIQINAGSIVGQFGNATRKVAFKLIQSGAAHFVASDAHETQKRNYQTMVEAHAELSKHLTDDQLDRLFFNNPQAAIAAQSIPMADPESEDTTERTPKWKKALSVLKRKLMS